MDRATDLGSVASLACLRVRDPHPPLKIDNWRRGGIGIHSRFSTCRSLSLRVQVPPPL
jgi:hypothetical protein